MPPTEGLVWTTSRKAAGNVLPLLLALPVLVPAIGVFGSKGASVELILWVAAFLVAAWFFLAVFGYAGNGSLKREMARRLHIERPFDRTPRYFVGFARPVYKSALDPHEDVGYLILHEDRLEFWGSLHRAIIERRDVTGVRFRANTHTLVGLGRWVSVEAVVEEKAVRLLVEPRERWTLLGNFLFSKKLLKVLREWQSEGPPADAGGPSVDEAAP